MLQILGLVSGFLVIIAYIPYIHSILHGKTKPERASWLIWFLLGGITFSSQVAKGATDSLWLNGTEVVGTLIVFTLALRFGVGGFTKLDISALIAASVGLVLWYYTNDAATALYIVIVINTIAALLTIKKTYKDPKSETFITWFLAGIAGVFSLLSVGSANIVLLSYPIHHLLINFGVAATILLGKRKSTR